MSGAIKANPFADKLLNTLRDLQGEGRKLQTSLTPEREQEGSGKSFAEHLRQGVQEVNAMSAKADRMGMEMSTGRSGNIHETMLAATQAELAFNLMVQVRNKGLEAYNEIMHMQV